jgi:hypothetical protein
MFKTFFVIEPSGIESIGAVLGVASLTKFTELALAVGLRNFSAISGFFRAGRLLFRT